MVILTTPKGRTVKLQISHRGKPPHLCRVTRDGHVLVHYYMINDDPGLLARVLVCADDVLDGRPGRDHN